MNKNAVDPNKAHKAIPVESTKRLDATAHTIADCRWCGRTIQESHSHMGQDAKWSHQRGTFA